MDKELDIVNLANEMNAIIALDEVIKVNNKKSIEEDGNNMQDDKFKIKIDVVVEEVGKINKSSKKFIKKKKECFDDIDSFLKNAKVILVDDAKNFDINEWEQISPNEIVEEINDIFDVDENQNVAMWPMNIINEIYGECANKEFANRLRDIIINNKKFEEEIEKVLSKFEDYERKIIYACYKEGISLKEFAECESKDIASIILLKKLSSL